MKQLKTLLYLKIHPHESLMWVGLSLLLGVWLGLSIGPAKACFILLGGLLTASSSACRMVFMSLGVGLVLSFMALSRVDALRLDRAYENKPWLLEGRVQGAVRQNGVLHLNLDKIFDLSRDTPHPLAGVIRLVSRTDTHKLATAARIKAWVSVKRVHSLSNPGAYHDEANALYRGIIASGKVLKLVDSEPATGMSITKWRMELARKLEHQLPRGIARELGLALGLGMQGALQATTWEILKRTGTTHLMAVSGLHVGITAVGLLMLFGALWRQSFKATLLLPTQVASTLLAGLGVGLYGMLVGFGVPTQRAVIMVWACGIAGLRRRRMLARDRLMLALMGILLLDPLAVHFKSFWLSFVAVSLVLYTSSLIACRSRWVLMGGQFRLACLMIPVALMAFSESAWISPLANLVAIPLVSLLILPLLLLGLLIPLPLSKLLLSLVGFLLKMLAAFLQHLATHSQMIAIVPIGGKLAMIVSVFGIILLGAPKGAPGRYWGVLGLLPLFLPPIPKIPPASMRFTLLDVGQGLASVVQTHTHSLVFDTGGAFAGRDRGKQVVIPYLVYSGVHHLDALVISHADLDHRGGARSIIRAYRPAAIYTSFPFQQQGLTASTCKTSQHWQWDGVRFWLFAGRGAGKNNQSCVLMVKAGKTTLLIPGDIQEEAEQDLVQRYGSQLKADILVAPHHGSKTSSSPQFLTQVSPKYTIFSTGYLNHYALPHPLVVKRYKQRSAKTFNTAHDGAITITINPSSKDSVIIKRARAFNR